MLGAAAGVPLTIDEDGAWKPIDRKVNVRHGRAERPAASGLVLAWLPRSACSPDWLTGGQTRLVHCVFGWAARLQSEAEILARVEYAKSSRARCRLCCEAILKDHVKVGLPIKWQQKNDGAPYGWCVRPPTRALANDTSVAAVAGGRACRALAAWS